MRSRTTLTNRPTGRSSSRSRTAACRNQHRNQKACPSLILRAMCTTTRSPVLLQRRPDQLRVRHRSLCGMTGPSDTSTISGFTQGGGPDLLSAVTRVAISALKAGWWHKWQQTMRIQPEAVGGLLEFCKSTTPPSARRCPGYAQCTMSFGRGSRT